MAPLAAVNAGKLFAFRAGPRSAPRKMFRVITFTGTVFAFFFGFASAPGAATSAVSATSAARPATTSARGRASTPIRDSSLKLTPSEFSLPVPLQLWSGRAELTFAPHLGYP